MKSFSILLLTISLVFLSCFPDVGFDRTKNVFQSNVWKNADKEGGEREGMLVDLGKRILIKNTSKSVIIDSLGIPDSIENHNFLYMVSKGMDPCYLIIEMNKQRRLDTFEIICH
jgi:hypothetical protein